MKLAFLIVGLIFTEAFIGIFLGYLLALKDRKNINKIADNEFRYYEKLIEDQANLIKILRDPLTTNEQFFEDRNRYN